MTASDPASADAVSDTSNAARAERLQDEVTLLSRRLREAEAARAGSESEIAALRADAELLAEERRLWVRRVVAPLLALERGLRWLGEKAGRAGGMVARQLVFRSKRLNRRS